MLPATALLPLPKASRLRTEAHGSPSCLRTLRAASSKALNHRFLVPRAVPPLPPTLYRVFAVRRFQPDLVFLAQRSDGTAQITALLASTPADLESKVFGQGIDLRERFICFRARRTLRVERMLRKGDCCNCMVSACFSVSSKTGSPVELAKSARTIVSVSVSLAWVFEGQYSAAAMTAKPAPAAASSHSHREYVRFLGAG